MTKISLIAACAVVLSGSAALAQGNWMPPGPSSGPGGASGAAPTRDVGTQPNVGNNPSAATTSSSMTQQENKQTSAGQWAPGQTYYNQQQAAAPMNEEIGAGGRMRHRVAITDEYGFHYDSRGDRLNAQGYVISPHTR
jgi:hypothetical protein